MHRTEGRPGGREGAPERWEGSRHGHKGEMLEERRPGKLCGRSLKHQRCNDHVPSKSTSEYLPKNIESKDSSILAHPCSKQHYPQQPKRGDNPSSHQRMMDAHNELCLRPYRVVHPYNRLLLSLKKEWNSGTC